MRRSLQTKSSVFVFWTRSADHPSLRDTNPLHWGQISIWHGCLDGNTPARIPALPNPYCNLITPYSTHRVFVHKHLQSVRVNLGLKSHVGRLTRETFSKAFKPGLPASLSEGVTEEHDHVLGSRCHDSDLVVQYACRSESVEDV